MVEFFIAVGNTSGSCTPAMSYNTKMMLALLHELLMALPANDAEIFKEWLSLGIEELGRNVVIELMQAWVSALLVKGQ